MKRQTSLAKELDLALRQLRPRLTRIEADVFDERAVQLGANVDRLARHQNMVNDIVQRVQQQFDLLLHAADDDIAQVLVFLFIGV